MDNFNALWLFVSVILPIFVLTLAFASLRIQQWLDGRTPRKPPEPSR
ncbi:hypothetical protein HMPREF9946_02204 [Acetobacteraceae bacterium AT-5844]|nr:hypothetical protein HMPREF9946_02204 [Acetobacteraceae bacterium AT-5844]